MGLILWNDEKNGNYETTQGEGNEREKVWVMDNTKVDIKIYDGETSICLRTVRGSGL